MTNYTMSFTRLELFIIKIEADDSTEAIKKALKELRDNPLLYKVNQYGDNFALDTIREMTDLE